MSNVNGVPHATNAAPYPTRPQWLFTYFIAGEQQQRVYHVRRFAEAQSRFAADEPAAYDVIATFEEVPLS